MSPLIPSRRWVVPLLTVMSFKLFSSLRSFLSSRNGLMSKVPSSERLSSRGRDWMPVCNFSQRPSGATWGTPCPHHPSTIRSQQRFRSKALRTRPAHQAMLLGQELLVFKIADEITAAQLVADAQEHPLLPQLEHVCAEISSSLPTPSFSSSKSGWSNSPM